MSLSWRRDSAPRVADASSSARFGAGRATLFAAAFAFCAVPLRWNSYLFFRFPALACAALALAFSASPRASALLARLKRLERLLSRRWDLLLFLFGAGISAFLAYRVLDPVAHVPDEMAYLFQAKTYAAGRFFLDDPQTLAFDVPWTLKHQGRWFGVFPPGWPAMLVPAVLAGVPFLANPLLGGLALVLFYWLFRDVAGAWKARRAALLMAASPFFLYQSATLFSHPSALLLHGLFWRAWLKASRDDEPRAYFWTGVAGGLLGLVRPQDAFAALACVAIAEIWTRRLGAWRPLLRIALAGLPFLLGLILYDKVLMGKWLRSPIAKASPLGGYGFGPNIGYPDWGDNFAAPGHGLWRALLNLNHNLNVLNSDLFGWPGCSLAAPLLFLCFGKWRRLHAVGALHALLVAALFAGFWYHGAGIGARFYFALLPFLSLCAVEGLALAPRLLGAALGANRRQARRAVAWLALSLAACSALLYLPSVGLVEYWQYRDVLNRAHRFAPRERIEGKAIVVMLPNTERAVSAILLNDFPLGSGDILYAKNLGDQCNRELMARYPGRKMYFYFEGRPKESWLSRLLRKLELDRLLSPR